MSWDHWQTFKTVLETGSLSAAARSLAISQPTAGRHIAALEEHFNAALFTRSQSGLLPTRLALALAPHADRMAAAAEALARTAADDSAGLHGVVRVTCSEVVGVEILPAILARYRHTHSGVQIELHLSNTKQDVLRRDADIAVRMLRPEQGKLLARKVTDFSLGLYAHQSYVSRRGLPVTEAELFEHDLIGFDRDKARLAAMSFNGRAVSARDFSMRCDNDLGQLACLRAGLGIGVCQDQIAARDTQLVPVLPGEFAANLPVWLVTHEDLKSDARVRSLFDFLSKAL